MKISDIDELFEKCWKGYEKKGMKTMFGKRVPNCVKNEEVEVEEDPYASQTIMDEDPPLGINYDYANLPKVDWDKYSTKAIKEFLSVIENLDFERGHNSDDFDDMHFNAAQWIEKNVLAKRQDESVELDEDMPDMAPVYPNIKSGINDAYSSIDEIDYAIVRLQKTIAEEYGDDIPDEYQEPLDFIIDIMNKKLPSALRHIADIAKNDEVYESINEDLRAWFGKGKKGGAGGGGWDRYNSKGERVGKCGDGKGKGKPKCLSKSAAAKLRNADKNKDGKKDGKAGIAKAVKRKQRNDPNKNRKGKAKNVKN